MVYFNQVTFLYYLQKQEMFSMFDVSDIDKTLMA